MCMYLCGKWLSVIWWQPKKRRQTQRKRMKVGCEYIWLVPCAAAGAAICLWSIEIVNVRRRHSRAHPNPPHACEKRSHIISGQKLSDCEVNISRLISSIFNTSSPSLTPCHKTKVPMKPSATYQRKRLPPEQKKKHQTHKLLSLFDVNSACRQLFCVATSVLIKIVLTKRITRDTFQTANVCHCIWQATTNNGPTNLLLSKRTHCAANHTDNKA